MLKNVQKPWQDSEVDHHVDRRVPLTAQDLSRGLGCLEERITIIRLEKKKTFTMIRLEKKEQIGPEKRFTMMLDKKINI